MAAPKKAGGGSGKKAKLAHEKRTNEDQGERAQFRLKKVVELVTDKAGTGAVVELDDKGTVGIVDSVYVLKAADGALKPREIACPALYDAVALQNAISRFQQYSA